MTMVSEAENDGELTDRESQLIRSCIGFDDGGGGGDLTPAICKLFMNPIDKVGKQEYSFSSRTDRVLKQVKPVRQEVLETVKQLKNSRCFPFGSISASGF